VSGVLGFSVLWALAIGVALFVNLATGEGRVPQLLVRALANGLVLLIFVRLKTTRRIWAAAPGPHRAILAVLFVLVAAGHFVNRSHATFPFVKWAMYSHAPAPDEIYYFRFEGIGADGGRVELYPAKLFPPLLNSRFYHKFEDLLQPVLPDRMKMKKRAVLAGLRGASVPRSAEEEAARITALLATVGEEYNRGRSGGRIEAVEAIACLADARKPWGTPAERTLVWRAELGTS